MFVSVAVSPQVWGLPRPPPPVAPPETDKGEGAKGKGKKGASWAREGGTHPYLKNFHKGLRFQRERCLRALEAARDADGAAKTHDADHHFARFVALMADRRP